MKYRITENRLRQMIRETVKNVLRESAVPQDEVIVMSEEQLENIQNIIMSDDPGSLYGGDALEGKIKLHYQQRDDDELYVTGTVYLLVNGDFDEEHDNGEAKWIRFKLNRGLTLYRYESDEVDAFGEPTYEWECAEIYRQNSATRILEMFLDFSNLY